MEKDRSAGQLTALLKTQATLDGRRTDDGCRLLRATDRQQHIVVVTCII